MFHIFAKSICTKNYFFTSNLYKSMNKTFRKLGGGNSMFGRPVNDQL